MAREISGIKEIREISDMKKTFMIKVVSGVKKILGKRGIWPVGQFLLKHLYAKFKCTSNIVN